jgi:hypothetical protein
VCWDSTWKAFSDCFSLTNVIIGQRVAYIGDSAFSGGSNLKGIHFRGNAPALGLDVFAGAYLATVYYLPGTTGWPSYFGGLPVARWTLPYPIILTFPPYFGVQTSRFGFRVSWATNRITVVEGCVNLASTNWVALSTNALVLNGWYYFNDPGWTNYPSRIYRVRSQ